jgi:DNA-binding cell septation regulator SpoVG
MTDTIPVRFEVVELRRLHSAGRLLALATVELDLGGIELTLHGVQVIQLPNGKLQCNAPRYRTPTGEWAPAVTLPDELELAIGAEILAAFTDPSSGAGS